MKTASAQGTMRVLSAPHCNFFLPGQFLTLTKNDHLNHHQEPWFTISHNHQSPGSDLCHPNSAWRHVIHVIYHFVFHLLFSPSNLSSITKFWSFFLFITCPKILGLSTSYFSNQCMVSKLFLEGLPNFCFSLTKIFFLLSETTSLKHIV